MSLAVCGSILVNRHSPDERPPVIGIPQMLALIAHQDNRCHHVYGDIRQIHELHTRSSDTVLRKGVLLSLRNNRWATRGVGTCYGASAVPHPAPSAVASDHSLRHAGAGGALSRAISDRSSLNI